jgi:hypothetical protein
MEKEEKAYEKMIEAIKSSGPSFLKKRKINDKTKTIVEIPKKFVRISPVYTKYMRAKYFQNNDAIDAWYEVKSDRLKKDREYTQHWYIARDQTFINTLINRHKIYIAKLSDEEKDTLEGYTFIGDTIINNFMRNMYDRLSTQIYRIFTAIERGEYPKLPLDWQIYHFFEYLTKSGVKTSYKKAELIDGKKLQRDIIHTIFAENVEWFSNPRNIEPLVTDLIIKTVKIILNAPRSNYRIKVYRGVTSEHLNSLNFISSDFWSTSYIPNSALKFAGLGAYSTYWCIYEITIMPDVPCLYISDLSKYSSEFEVLLPPFIQYRTSDKVDLKGLYTDDVYDGKPIIRIPRNGLSITSNTSINDTNETEKNEMNAFNNSYHELFANVNNIAYDIDPIFYRVATITAIADKFNEKGLEYLERKRHWRNVKEEADIDEYLEKVARKEKYNLLGVPVEDDEFVPVSSRRSIRKKHISTRKSRKRNSFKRLEREEERRKTRKLKRLSRKVHTINTSN